MIVSGGHVRAAVDAIRDSRVGFRGFPRTRFARHRKHAAATWPFRFDPHLPDHAPEIDLVRGQRADQLRDDRDTEKTNAPDSGKQ
ncbi:hypothetical protein HR51_25055 [Burkholderia cepacia]|nr:hypothetical protein HR51_25055 [Burkholderia cepacia]